MKEKKVTIRDIDERIYKAHLDTEYREALAHSIKQLNYVTDTPYNLYFGNQKQKDELERIETMPLDSNQISEIIHLMMYELRNDFQYGIFKPIANYYIDISKEMKKENNEIEKCTKEYKKPICNVYEVDGYIPDIIGLASKTLKQNNMYEESREMIERATLSYSYDEAYDIIGEYVEIVKERENQLEFE